MDHNTPLCSFPQAELKKWFLNEGRHLPWRVNPTPYSVWISEIMLQQTQAQVVKTYFHKWMEEFPTIMHLASSPIEKVLKTWEGLGYYSRARFLHEAARIVVKNYGGDLPNSREELAKIKGIGPYTQGAILSFAFHQKAAAVDGNVLRLLSRFYAIEEPIDHLKTRKKIEELTLALLPEHEPWIVMEAMIELGATVCKKKAVCSLCPIKEGCLAHRNTLQEKLPVKKGSQTITALERLVAVIICEDRVLVQRGEKGKVMADLYEFPYLETGEEKRPVEQLFEKKMGMKLTYLKKLPLQQHSFTRYRVKLFPHLLRGEMQDSRFTWKNFAELCDLPFSSGHRRILNTLEFS